MRVQDVMSRDVMVVSPWESLKTAARRMADLDVGALPVGEAVIRLMSRKLKAE